jgi:small-conductance mechanosensitive channel
VGDQIQTDTYRGTVKEIGSRTTVLETTNGISIHIPNVEVADKVIEVYTTFDSRKASVSFNVGFTTDLNDLTSRLIKSMTVIDLVESDPAPSVQATGFDDGGITVSVGFWYASSHSSDSDAVDAVVRSIQSTLSDTGITPVTSQIFVEEATSHPTETKATDTGETSQGST